MSYVYVMFTVLLTIYEQIFIKWQVTLAGALPPGMPERIHFCGRCC